MDLVGMFGEGLTEWMIIPLLLFVARILDVSMGTIRIIMISKGYKSVAPILGFVEVFIWIVAVGKVMQHMDNLLYYIAYAAGFAAGTYVGMYIENKLSLGLVMVRVITKFEAVELLNVLREGNYNATSVNGEGRHGEVKILFMIIKRHSLKKVINLIREYNPNAFYTIEDIREVSGGVFPAPSRNFRQMGLSVRRSVAKKK